MLVVEAQCGKDLAFNLEANLVADRVGALVAADLERERHAARLCPANRDPVDADAVVDEVRSAHEAGGLEAGARGFERDVGDGMEVFHGHHPPVSPWVMRVRSIRMSSMTARSARAGRLGH